MARGNRDAYGRRVDYLRISITDRCNLRCVYCMPEEGVTLAAQATLLSFTEIWRVARAAHAIGFRKFRITGGEPLVVRDVVAFVRGLKAAVGDSVVALTTNAVRLAPLAAALRQAGVQRVNISLDTLQPTRFASLCRRDQWAEAWGGLQAALQAGFERVKINVVVVAGINDDEVLDLAKLAEQFPVDVRFIEHMPSIASACDFVTAAALVARLRQVYDLCQVTPADLRQAAALVYTAPGLQGTLGVIAPRSRKFCAQCNRLRLTPGGELKGCLLTPGGIQLRDALRGGVSDAELQKLLAFAVGNKPWAYDDAHYGLDRSMSALGG